jgi:hypothetical protein
MLPKEKPDYEDWSDTELTDALNTVDKNIEQYQKTIALYRKNINRSMEDKEDLLDVIKQRAQKKGWTK